MDPPGRGMTGSPVAEGLGVAAWPSTAAWGLPSRIPVDDVLLAGSPKYWSRPFDRATSLAWSTWLMANSTMNSAMSSVIMSA